MAGSVIGAALEHIVPGFGLVENGDSGNGRHFTSQVPQGLMRSSQIRRDFHTPWQPPSSRKVERMSRALKKHPTKLASSHPAQSVSGGGQPLGIVGLPPYGLPCISRTQVGPLTSPPWKLKTHLSGTVNGPWPPLTSLRLKGLLAQLPPLEFAVHPYHPVLVTWCEASPGKETNFGQTGKVSTKCASPPRLPSELQRKGGLTTPRSRDQDRRKMKIDVSVQAPVRIFTGTLRKVS